MKKLHNEEFVKRAKVIHGDKYDYSKVNYVNAHEYVTIICPKHGEFNQAPYAHLRGRGCPKCGIKKISDSKILSQDDFIKKAKKVHGDKYDYSKVEYKNNRAKITIICPEHGEFEQRANNHLNGCGCPKCGIIKNHSKSRKTTKEFIEKAKQVHGDKYDYSKVKYINNSTKVIIVCPVHGEFEQTPEKHLRGHGCQKCASINSAMKQRLTTEKFIERSKKVHGDKYDYSKVEYKTINDKVCIICPKHGEFWQVPYSHLKGCGCPICKESKLEQAVRKLLDSANIGYIEHCNKNTIKWIGKQHLDFYLPEYKIAIECQGIQHYKEIHFFNKKDGFKKLKKLDKIKKDLCQKNNIKLFYIPYNLNKKQIENKIKKILLQFN